MTRAEGRPARWHPQRYHGYSSSMTAFAANVRSSHGLLPMNESFPSLFRALAPPKPPSSSQALHTNVLRAGLKDDDRLRHSRAPTPYRNGDKRCQSSGSSSNAKRRLPSSSGRKRHTIDSYYNDLLKRPLPSQTSATHTPPAPPPPETLPKTDRESRLAKARVVFGSRLAGPADRRRELDANSQEIAGVVVPPRPTEPDNCCMSGCVNCVWDRYREELEEWAGKVGEVRTKLKEGKSEVPTGLEDLPGGPRKPTRREESQDGALPTHVATSMDDDGGGSETNWDVTRPMGGGAPGAPASLRSADLFQDIPIGIREFMRTEKRLKEKRKGVAG